MAHNRIARDSAFRSDRESDASARRLGIFAYIGCALGVVIAIQMLVESYYLVAAINLVFAAALLTMRAWGVRSYERLRVASHLAIAAGVADIVLVAIFRTDVGALGMWALVLVPLIGAYLIGPRAAVAWTLVAFAVLGVFGGRAIATGDESFGGVDPVTTLFFQIVLVGAVLAFAVVARRLNDRQYRELAEHEHELEEYAHQLEEASAARSKFMSHMSHELRTPLNVMMGFAQMLHQRADDPASREQLSHIIDAGQQLLRLINEALEIDGLEDGRVELDVHAVALDGVVDDAVRFIAPAAEEKNVAVEVVEPIGARYPIVRADPSRLSQAALNLLSNAVTHSRPGGKVTVEARSDNDTASLSISDSGPGLTPDRIEQIFEPFESGDQIAAGLGLPVTRALVEAMGGELSVVGKPRDGTIFTIRLDIADVEADEAVVSTEPIVGVRESGAAHGSLLYIEDNPNNITLFEAITTERPHVHLGIATRGEDGVRAACRDHPDLIVLDLHLPDMDGVKVLRRLQSDPRTAEIPVIVLSADATDEMISSAMTAGAADYLTKPIGVDSVLHTLDSHLGNGDVTRRD